MLGLEALLVFLGLGLTTATASDFDPRGGQFIGFDNFSAFRTSPGARAGETVLTSPEIAARIHWNELIASWNADMPRAAYLRVEVRALYPASLTKYYTMGLWSVDTNRYPRESVLDQKDPDGDVKTDTLILARPCNRLQIRLTFGGDDGEQPKLKFLGLDLADTAATPPTLPSNPAALGRTIPVPERTQMTYTNGAALCSPAAVSMVMAYWASQLHRPELDHDVPDIANAIYDPKWPGTGNWPFNTAYAGSFRGVRAYVTRLSDLSEVEDWIAAGIPVVISVSSYLTNDRTSGPDNGHLIVCVGFTETGDVVTNDPGVSVRRNVRARRVYARQKVAKAWSKSKNTVYLIYPETTRIPSNRLGHWAG